MGVLRILWLWWDAMLQLDAIDYKVVTCHKTSSRFIWIFVQPAKVSCLMDASNALTVIARRVLPRLGWVRPPEK